MPVKTVDSDLIDPKDAAEHLRNNVVQIVRSEMSKPWQAMHQHEQERLVTRIEDICVTAVRKVCDAIASHGKNVVPAAMGALSTDSKGNPAVKLTFSTSQLEDEDKLALFSHIGRPVTLVMMDPAEYQNFKTKVSTMPDQHEIPGTAPKGDGQPDWPTVAAAVADPPAEAPPQDDFAEDVNPPRPPMSDAQREQAGLPKRDAADAHKAEDDDVAIPDDDSAIEDMDAAEAASMVDIPNPANAQGATTAKGPNVPTGINPPKVRPPRQAPKR